MWELSKEAENIRFWRRFEGSQAQMCTILVEIKLNYLIVLRD